MRDVGIIISVVVVVGVVKVLEAVAVNFINVSRISSACDNMRRLSWLWEL